MPVFEDNSRSIGRTPMVRINRIVPPGKATVFAKIEGRNPAFSVKCRIGAAMIWDAEERGVLTSGMEIIEPTSGNTGIALAFVAAARGYGCTLVMPESMSLERRKVLKAFGANLILTPASLGMGGAIEKAEEFRTREPDRYFMPQQFDNPANTRVHESTTGPEIWEDTHGEIDVFVAGVGTGGTITGVSRYLKKTRGKSIVAVAVEPASSPVIAQRLRGEPLEPGPHRIQGIGAGFLPKILELDLIDRVEHVTDDEAFTMARRLASEEGLLCGISCGAAMTATARLAEEPEFRGKTVVTILADAGERYLSSALFSSQFEGLDHAIASDQRL